MVRSVVVVRMGNVGVMRCHLVLPCFVVLRGLLMVVRRVFVMLCCLMMMLRCLLRHTFPPTGCHRRSPALS
jgi:hypothetical protein